MSDGKISQIRDGWKKLTDLLRAQLFCTETHQLLEYFKSLQESPRVKVIRLKPRFGFGPKAGGLNDLTVNFIYKGQMVCELQMKLILKDDLGLQPFLHSNHFVYEVQRCCEYKQDDWDQIK